MLGALPIGQAILLDVVSWGRKAQKLLADSESSNLVMTL